MYELYNHLVHYFGRALQQDKDEGEKNHKKGGWIVFLETSSTTF